MANLKGNVLELAKKIKLLAFDVDGVMTDGSVTYDENGVEYKTFNVKDGHGIVRANKSGFITAIITARNNGTVQHRAENLKITEIYQGQKYKLPALEEIMAKYGANLKMVDRIPDALSGAMGNQMYVGLFDTEEEMNQFYADLDAVK